MLFEEERKQKIADYVFEHKRASVQELTAYFNVSESTIRRDLKGLEEAKLLRRTHGGAVANGDDNAEPPFEDREDRYRSQKEAIARVAASIIREGDIVLLDSGTTTYYLAKRLKTFNKLTVVTNSLKVAQELAGHKGIELVLSGGTVREETLAMVGPLAQHAIGSVRVNKVFLAANGIDPHAGITTPNMIEAAVKRQMIQFAGQVVLLADHSKYGTISYAKVADLSEIDQCIMDDGISQAAVKEMESAGIDVTLTSAGSEEA
jgi:DeoR family fructose operon transcriptional repressor